MRGHWDVRDSQADRCADARISRHSRQPRSADTLLHNPPTLAANAAARSDADR
jgi:hypothetical protein